MTVQFNPSAAAVDACEARPAPPVCRQPAAPAVAEPACREPADLVAVNNGASQQVAFTAGGTTFPADVQAARRPRGPQCRPGDAPAESQVSLDSLRSQLQTMRASGGLSGSRLQTIERLLGTAEQQGLLQRQDARGVSLLQHLSRIAATPPSTDLIAFQTTQETIRATSGHVMVAVLENLTAPEAITQRGSSCAARALEYTMATQDPAGYAAMVGDLAAGRDAAGHGGRRIVLDRTALGTEAADNSRNMASRVLQSSVNHTMISNWLGQRSYTNGDLETVKARGLDQGEAARAAHALLGPGWATHGGAPDLTNARFPMVVAVRWHMSADELKEDDPSNGHALVVTRVENGRAYFVDPGTSAQPGATVQADGSEEVQRNTGPTRRGEGNGVYSMPVGDLQRLVEYYTEPPAQ